ncbi:uncharacterized protein [Aquarana catesbeiana]|uniref:uncharacterized protein n=1 Tax=Aquarana catesbeiana TaxID=8400 RepID=UPI003CCA30B3
MPNYQKMSLRLFMFTPWDTFDHKSAEEHLVCSEQRPALVESYKDIGAPFSMMASTMLLLSLLAGVGTVTVVQNPPSLTVDEGDMAEMFCDIRNVTGKIQITGHYWFVNLHIDPVLLRNDSRTIVTQNSLTIKSVTADDAKLYFCIVRDRKLNQYSGNGTRLSVRGVGTVTVVQNPPSLTVYEGDMAEMFCDIRNVGKIQITDNFWYVNLHINPILLRNDSRTIVTQNSLTIKSVTANDAKLYFCTVRDTKQIQYPGNGTRLSVRAFFTSATPHTTPYDEDEEPDFNDYHYLYHVILLILLVLALALYWKCVVRRGERR